MNDDEKNVLSQTADAITEKAITITIDIIHPTLFDKVKKRTKKTFTIQPATLGTLIKISRAFLSIEINNDQKNWMELTHKLMVAHTETLARVIGYAIVNRKEDPPQSLINFLMYNLTAEEMAVIAKHVMNQMNITSFISSIVSIKGTNILETSLNQRS